MRTRLERPRPIALRNEDIYNTVIRSQKVFYSKKYSIDNQLSMKWHFVSTKVQTRKGIATYGRPSRQSFSTRVVLDFNHETNFGEDIG